jgi:hypothetical protein
MRRQQVVVEMRVRAATSATDKAPCRCKMSSSRRSSRSMTWWDVCSTIADKMKWTFRIIGHIRNEHNIAVSRG